MREKDNSRIYIKYKDKKRVQKLKQEDILKVLPKVSGKW